MKKRILTTFLVLIGVIILVLSIAMTASAAGNANGSKNQNGRQQGNRQQYGDCSCFAGTAQIKSLSEDETYWLTYMREEEKLARDVYLALYEKWGEPIFKNIADSEQRHMDAVERLLVRYGIDDPVADESVPGNFTIGELNTIYETLITRGFSSLDEAYQVGADIETADINDLQEAIIVSSEHKDIVRVYNNLLKGSNNHLDAFNSHLN